MERIPDIAKRAIEYFNNKEEDVFGKDIKEYINDLIELGLYKSEKDARILLFESPLYGASTGELELPVTYYGPDDEFDTVVEDQGEALTDEYVNRMKNSL